MLNLLEKTSKLLGLHCLILIFIPVGTFLLQSPDVLSVTEAALRQGYRLIGTSGF